MKQEHHAELVWSNSIEPVEVEISEGESYQQTYEKFGIDDARELVRRAHNKPLDSQYVTFVVRTNFITLEAQNALLKVMEEPPISTKFIFVLPPDFTMLPTLLSRFNVNDYSAQKIEANDSFSLFLTSNFSERLTAIDKSAKSKDAEWQREIKKGLIDHIRLSNCDNKSLGSLEYVARTLLTRGSSNKMLLEQAALIL
jgi:DNA polymerase III delta prime subunit